MTANRELKITVLGDSSKGTKALDKVEKKSGKLRKGLGKLGSALNSSLGALGAGAGVAGLAAFGNSLFDMSSQLESTRNAIDDTFGDSVGTVQKWAAVNAEKMGMTETQVAGLAAEYGALIKATGMTTDQTAKLSTQLGTAAAALAQYSGGKVSTQQASEMMQAALIGEYDSIQRLGVAISAAKVEERLAKEGKDKLTGAALDQAKAEATVALIMESSQVQMKAYAEGTNRLAANKAKAQAAFARFKEFLATNLIPAFINLAAIITEKVVPKVMEITRFVNENKAAIIAATTVVLALGAAWVVAAKGAAVLAKLKGAFVALKGAMALALGPVGLIVLGLAAVAAGVIYAYQKSETFRKVVHKVFEFAQQAFQKFKEVAVAVFAEVVKWIVTEVIPRFKQMWADIKPVLEMLWEKAKEVFGKIKEFISTTVSTIQKLWKRWGDDILSFAKKTWDNIKGVIEGVMDVIQGIIKTVTGLIRGDWKQVWEGVKQITSGIWKAIKSLISQAIESVKAVLKGALGVIKALWSEAWERIKGAASRAWEGIKGVIRGAIDNVKSTISGGINSAKGIWNRALDAIRSKASGIWSGIKGIVSGAIESIKRKINDLFDRVRAIPGRIRGAVGRAVRNLPGASLLSKIPGLAHGGTVTRSGLTLVGEQGPELLKLPRGASVIPLSKGAHGGEVIHHHYNVNIAGTAAPMDERGLLSTLRRVELLHG